jgi:hypothetical protein
MGRVFIIKNNRPLTVYRTLDEQGVPLEETDTVKKLHVNDVKPPYGLSVQAELV